MITSYLFRAYLVSSYNKAERAKPLQPKREPGERKRECRGITKGTAGAAHRKGGIRAEGSAGSSGWGAGAF